jgi:hypothetical protein
MHSIVFLDRATLAPGVRVRRCFAKGTPVNVVRGAF